MLAGGVSIKELAEYLGHNDTALLCVSMLKCWPCSHDRARAVFGKCFTRMMGCLEPKRQLARTPAMITEQ